MKIRKLEILEVSEAGSCRAYVLGRHFRTRGHDFCTGMTPGIRSPKSSFKRLPAAWSGGRTTSVIFATGGCTGILLLPDFNGQIPHMHSLTDTFLRIPFRWWIVLISCTVG